MSFWRSIASSAVRWRSIASIGHSFCVADPYDIDVPEAAFVHKCIRTAAKPVQRQKLDTRAPGRRQSPRVEHDIWITHVAGQPHLLGIAGRAPIFAAFL